MGCFFFRVVSVLELLRVHITGVARELIHSVLILATPVQIQAFFRGFVCSSKSIENMPLGLIERWRHGGGQTSQNYRLQFLQGRHMMHVKHGLPVVPKWQ